MIIAKQCPIPSDLKIYANANRNDADESGVRRSFRSLDRVINQQIGRAQTVQLVANFPHPANHRDAATSALHTGIRLKLKSFTAEDAAWWSVILRDVVDA